MPNAIAETEGPIGPGSTIHIAVTTEQTGMVFCFPRIESAIPEKPAQHLRVQNLTPKEGRVTFEVVVPKHLVDRPLHLVIVIEQSAVKKEEIDYKKKLTLSFGS